MVVVHCENPNALAPEGILRETSLGLEVVLKDVEGCALVLDGGSGSAISAHNQMKCTLSCSSVS